jgi:ribose 5-phosphate isomerase A
MTEQQVALDVPHLKREAAEWAVRYVKPGMVVGLGEGSTAIFAILALARLLHSDQLWDIIAVPSSIHVEHEARQLGISLTTLEEHSVIDLTIDGADEVDSHLNLIKGGGGALLREKIVAQASDREIIVVDDSKLSPAVGTHHALPVEVVPFGWRTQANYLESLGAQVTMRQNNKGVPFKTDQGNLILDCDFGPIAQPEALATQLNARVGIVEHGLFLGLATEIVVAGPAGVRHITPGD